MAKRTTWAFFAAIAVLLISCSKKNSSSPSDIKQDTITVESIIRVPVPNTYDDLDPNRKGFIDLYDGVAYSQTEAASVSSKIDFAYNYHGGGCNTCRFFENVLDMSTRTYYVQSFSTITDSRVSGTTYGHFPMTDNGFDSLRTAANIESLFTKYQLAARIGPSDEITNRSTDAIASRFFAFIDKNGKKGFFKISDYVANPPDGSPTPIKLYVKIQK